MFILRGLLRAETQEKILIYLYLKDKGYGVNIAEAFDLSKNAVQKQLVRLEEDSVLVSEAVGRVRQYQLNPRYVFIKPLKELLKSAIQSYPNDQLKDLLMVRTRPRKSGKRITKATNV